jgi:hypothetical protein
MKASSAAFSRALGISSSNNENNNNNNNNNGNRPLLGPPSSSAGGNNHPADDSPSSSEGGNVPLSTINLNVSRPTTTNPPRNIACPEGQVYGKPPGSKKYRCFTPSSNNHTNYHQPENDPSRQYNYKVDKNGRYFKTSATVHRGRPYYIDNRTLSHNTRATWNATHALTEDEWERSYAESNPPPVNAPSSSSSHGSRRRRTNRRNTRRRR